MQLIWKLINLKFSRYAIAGCVKKATLVTHFTENSDFRKDIFSKANIINLEQTKQLLTSDKVYEFTTVKNSK